MNPIDEVPFLIKRLYENVSEFERLFPGRHFTPDGHLVGSIGEVLAAYYYNLNLAPASTGGYDATTQDGRLVEIKATQGNLVGLRSNPNHLLVLKILRDGQFEEIFNGPGQLVWEKAGNPQRNGQKQISLSKLRSLMIEVLQEEKIPRLKTNPG